MRMKLNHASSLSSSASKDHLPAAVGRWEAGIMRLTITFEGASLKDSVYPVIKAESLLQRCCQACATIGMAVPIWILSGRLEVIFRTVFNTHFCCRKDRVTVQEREAEALKQKELEQEAKRVAEERRKYTLKVLE